MKKGQEPAFPIFLQEGLSHNSHVDCGMSTRQLIAKDILCSLISNADRHSQEGDCMKWNYDHLSQIALQATDSLLKQEEESRQ